MRLALTLFVTLALSTISFAQDGFVVVGARVFDGETIRDDVVVVVQGDRITTVLANTPYNPKPGLEIVNGQGKTLIPGLIDAHCHPWQQVDLKQAMAFGVTTELSMMNQPSLAKTVREAQAKGELRDHADLHAAGFAVTAPGGHGTLFGLAVPTVTESADVGAFVAKRVEEGSDFIKIIYEHGEAYGAEMPALSNKALRAAVAAAHEHERLAVVHVSTQAEGLAALAAKADGLAHVWMDQVPMPESLLGFGKPGARPFVIPALTVIEGIERTPGAPATLAGVEAFRPYLAPANLTNLRRTWVGLQLGEGNGLSVAKRTVAALHELGFPILAGADAPNPGVLHGASLHRELELLVEAGLTPSEALRAATAAPAAAFRLNDRGRIAEGLRADLLLVEGDPTADITATRQIARVWKAGTEFDRAAYAAAVQEEVAKLAKIPAPPGLTEGPAADFEEGQPKARFGSFMPSTDMMRGGSSSVQTSVVEGGPGESAHCLRLEGTVTEKAKLFRWAAVLYSPSFPLTPANLSAASGVRFQARGKGPIFLGVMARRLGQLPVIRHLEVSEEWQTFEFSWDALDGLDGTDVTGFMFGADRPGEFWLEIDEVRFE
jgi:imidazolonepropionase-like amidohydrolase